MYDDDEEVPLIDHDAPFVKLSLTLHPEIADRVAAIVEGAAMSHGATTALVMLQIDEDEDEPTLLVITQQEWFTDAITALVGAEPVVMLPDLGGEIL